ncbi:MAG TPA: PQQ-binding-like beta-propeller repeat protein [Pirellulaceae bacterium]|nr:PQQ-binding-like beta-propeller repeat protein [Pirellulaceae bacterium]
MFVRHRFHVAAMLTLLVTGAVALGDETNWPRWRGPQGNGHSTETELPVKWSSSDVLWQTTLPGSGQSSPIVWGEKIFLTSALHQGQERLVLCVDRQSGKIHWQQTAWKGEPEPVHRMNGWASASCATDGQIVVAFFGRGGIHAYSVEGQHLWSRDLGQFAGIWGTAACPILVDDLVIQNCDADEDAYIVALDKQTGKDVWRTKRRDHRGWSTPIVVDTLKRREIVVNGHEGVQAYDPATGRELWFCQSFNGRGEPTVTPAGDLLCVVNGLAGDIYSVRPGGDGDVTATHMAWHTPRQGGRDCPSPIVVGKFIIVCDMSGVATCYDADDGRIHWKERISGKLSGSPIAASGLVYFLNEEGKTIVVKPGTALKIVAENELSAGKDEIFRASLTPVGGQFLLRSTTALYCVGENTR